MVVVTLKIRDLGADRHRETDNGFDGLRHSRTLGPGRIAGHYSIDGRKGVRSNV